MPRGINLAGIFDAFSIFFSRQFVPGHFCHVFDDPPALFAVVDSCFDMLVVVPFSSFFFKKRKETT